MLWCPGLWTQTGLTPPTSWVCRVEIAHRRTSQFPKSRELNIYILPAYSVSLENADEYREQWAFFFFF